MAEGLEEGPRKPGHSGSPAKAQAARRKSDAITLLMILLDYKCRETSGERGRFFQRVVRRKNSGSHTVTDYEGL